MVRTGALVGRGAGFPAQFSASQVMGANPTNEAETHMILQLAVDGTLWMRRLQKYLHLPRKDHKFAQKVVRWHWVAMPSWLATRQTRSY